MNETKVLKDILVLLLEKTFEAKNEYTGFKIAIVPKELKSKHGQYIPNDRKIEIFNLARSPGCTMLTCIHELAHHVEFMDLGETGHKKTFYNRFYKLLLTALSFGLVTKDDLENDSKDSRDYKKLIDYHGIFEYWEYELTEEAKICYVLIENAYNQREILKQRGYKFYQKSQSWGKEFPNKLYANRESKLLKDAYSSLELDVVGKPTILFSLNYYVAVHGAYDQRVILKKNGYVWESYGIKGAWVKKVPTRKFYQEELFLKEARLVYKKVTPTK